MYNVYFHNSIPITSINMGGDSDETALTNGLNNNNNGVNKDAYPVETRCGLFNYRPKWMQALANVKLFTFCISMFSVIQGKVVEFVEFITIIASNERFLA